jgi:restriction system protein
MPIPDYQTVQLPLLQTLSDGQEHLTRDLIVRLAGTFQLTPPELEAKLPSGQQRIFHNRVGWAKSHMKAAGLLEQPGRGRVRITQEGRDLLAKNPSKITIAMLKEYPSFHEFWSKSKNDSEAEPSSELADEERSCTPLEQLNASYNILHEATKDELLNRLKSSAPAFFEKAVVKLLVAMGYGGVGGEAKVTGQPGDGGIDGVIAEDKLGLDVICVQAKRYDHQSVGRPAVQAFVGSMDFVRSKKGVILTTSTFTQDARHFVDKIEGKKVVLVDGDMLADLMLAHDIGVTKTNTYELKEVSNDFFDEEDG